MLVGYRKVLLFQTLQSYKIYIGFHFQNTFEKLCNKNTLSRITCPRNRLKSTFQIASARIHSVLEPLLTFPN